MASETVEYTSLQQTREVFLRRFLRACLCVIIFYIIFDTYHHIYMGLLTDITCGIAVIISLFFLQRNGLKPWHIHLTLLGGMTVFAPLLIIESFENTGIYWLPALPVLIFMLGGTRTGVYWGICYYVLLFASIIASLLGWAELQCTWSELFFMMLVTIFISIIAYFFGSHLEKTEIIFLLQQDQLRHALKDAESSNLAKTQFLSSMSHDLRTPLHGMIGMQELLASDNTHWSDEQREYLQLSLASSKALKSLINDVLDMAKIEANKIVVAEQPVDILSSLQEITLPFIFSAQEKHLQLDLALYEVPHIITGDAKLLRHIMVNLLSNAIKFTEQGSIHMRVEKDVDTPQQLKFSVQDTGIGISITDQQHVFEPFYQCGDVSNKLKGTGLGTSIVKQYVELQGGIISLCSQPGEGSCFSFTLPYQTTNQQTHTLKLSMQELMPSYNKPTISQNIQENNKPLHILLVEDDPIGQRIATKTLQRAGMHVDAAKDGGEALLLLKNHAYDLMLTDLRMPGIDGITLTKKIRTQEKNSGFAPMPIIGLSAHALSSAIDEALACGMNAFLSKPIEPSAILASLQKTKEEHPRPQTESHHHPANHPV